MNYTGNTDYKDIPNKQYLTLDTDKQQDIISELNRQNIPFSARYDDEKITVTFSKSDFENVNAVINSVGKDVLQEQEQYKEANAVNLTIEELQQQMLRMQAEQESLRKQLDEKNNKQPQDVPQMEAQPEQQSPTIEEKTEEKSVEPIPEPTFDIQELNTEKDSYKLLPIISSKVENQQQRIDTLTAKKTVAEDKISIHQARINHLTEKAERLSTTSQMLKELVNSKMTPAFVKSAAEKVIKVNEDKIAKIRNEKIPTREAKIEKQQNKIAKLDRKINLTQCKLNRYTSLNKVITSFSLINNSKRRKQFSTAMDELHKNSVNLYNAKIDISTAKIVDLTDKYKKSNNITFKSAAMESITRQKISRQKCIDKRNKLIGVIVPMTQQSEKVQDEALRQTEKAVNDTLGKENVTVAEVVDNVAIAPLPALPEHCFVEPDPTPNVILMLPEIATVLDMSVSELESKPMDIKQMLVLDYTNNFESAPEDIQESLSAIINPNVSVEKNLENAKAEKQIESNRPTEPVTQNQNIAQQSEKKLLTMEQLEFLMDEAVPKENPLKTVEELVEGNANMIDGVINNESPKKEEPKKEEKPKEKFSFSRKSMNRNAQKISSERNHRDEKDRKPPDHGSI